MPNALVNLSDLIATAQGAWQAANTFVAKKHSIELEGQSIDRTLTQCHQRARTRQIGDVIEAGFRQRLGLYDDDESYGMDRGGI